MNFPLSKDTHEELSAVILESQKKTYVNAGVLKIAAKRVEIIYHLFKRYCLCWAENRAIFWSRVTDSQQKADKNITKPKVNKSIDATTTLHNNFITLMQC